MKKHIFLLISFLVAFSVLSCKNKVKEPEIQQENLEEEYHRKFLPILDFFDNKVSDNCAEETLSVCYIDHCNSIWQQFQQGSVYFDTTGLYELVSKSGIGSGIWVLSAGQMRTEFQGEWKNKLMAGLNIDNDHYRFLIEQSAGNVVLAKYFENIEQTGVIGSPGSNSILLSNCGELDFNDITVRTIYAIHWITYYFNYL